jgi:hypothetical protein
MNSSPHTGLLRAAVGYRVTAPEGDTGVVVRVPEAGRPPRPLVLVVRRGDTFRFLPIQLVERVLPEARQVLVRPQMGPSHLRVTKAA